MSVVSEGGGLPSALGKFPLPLPLPLPLLLLFPFPFSEGVVKGDFCSVLGSELGSSLGNLLGSKVGGQFSVIISFGVGW